MRLLAAAALALCLLALPAAMGQEDSSKPAANATHRATPWIEALSWRPRAFLYHNFLSLEECDHIIEVATPSMARSSVINADGSVGDDPIRTSYGTFLSVSSSREGHLAACTLALRRPPLPLRPLSAARLRRGHQGH